MEGNGNRPNVTLEFDQFGLQILLCLQKYERIRAQKVKVGVEQGDALERPLCYKYYIAEDDIKCQKGHK